MNTLAPDFACLALCLAAALYDLRIREIPDWIATCGALAGLGLNVALPLLAGTGDALQALLLSAGGGVALFVAFGSLGALEVLGMGDVKLLGAVGCLVGLPLALAVTLDVLLAGGVLALLVALRRGVLGRSLRNVVRLGRRLERDRTDLPVLELGELPYALAILGGVAWAILGRYVPGLRLV